ncbi:transporter [Sphingomonas sp. KRR8]|uniref:transporter n=1 Tax=Sphingomonas sp. KRR8 TaxID=2942996 RepID=UPI00202141FC|nr:transporter [Sphingomonas sp. KRR8]URD60035.1 transporter [Sphingomonas sp. KRR8]
MRSHFALLALAFVSSPALADHMGPSGVASGGGQIVFGPDTLDEGHGSLGFRLTFTRPEQRSDAVLEALAGQHIHAHNTNYNLNASVGAAYGITHELTLSAELPYVRRDGLREGEHSHVDGQAINEVTQLGNVAGIGDLNVLAKYRLTHGDGLNVAAVIGLKVPTGRTGVRSPDGERLETEHQPGTGSWDPIVGASAGSTLGPVQLAASALYQFSGRGAQDTRLGDRFQAGVALSHRFGIADHDHAEPAHHHDHDDDGDNDGDHHAHPAHASWDGFVELSGEWEGRQTIAGEVEEESGGKALWLTPGARFTSAGGFSFGASVGLPAWQRIRASHPKNRYRVSLAVARAF